jgi:peptide deformylase
MSKKIKYIDGNLVEFELFKLVDKYDPVLYTPTQPINFADPQIDLGYLTLSLIETMTHHNGMGISANQVGLPYRVCVINMGKEAFPMFNPKITMRAGGASKLREGCLSFPGLYLETGRFDACTVEFQSIDGSKHTLSFEGIPAVCIQHELDHLDGVAFTKRVSPLVLEREQRKIKKNLKKMRQVAEREQDSISY